MVTPSSTNNPGRRASHLRRQHLRLASVRQPERLGRDRLVDAADAAGPVGVLFYLTL
jgi:hypothetical protein